MPPPLEPELRQHSAALRALARSLVGAQHADDLVQDTTLQVLHQPPPQPEGLRPWLLRVLRFRAGKLRRGEQRRLRREEQATVPEAPSTPQALAERMETLTRLHDALRELPEPYRGTLLQRFFEDLTPTAIAERSGTPLATVKSRLQRGLELLRTRLEASTRDWRESLVLTFGLPAAPITLPTTTAAAIAGTGVFMAGKLKLVGGTVAAAAVVTAGWWVTAPTTNPRLVASAPFEATPVLAALPTPAGEAPRQTVLPSPPAGPCVQVRVLDNDGHVMPDVEVFHLLSPDRFRDLDAAGTQRLVAVQHDKEAMLREFGIAARTDSEGIARWPRREAERSWWLAGASHGDAFGELWISTQLAADEVSELRLVPTRAFPLLVQDADLRPADGVPVVARFARATDKPPRDTKRIAITDHDGHAVARNLQTWRDQVAALGAARPVLVSPDLPGIEVQQEVDVANPPAEPVRLVLPPTGVLEVAVLDALGQPAPAGTTVRIVQLPIEPGAPSWSTSLAAHGTASFPRVGLQRRWRLTSEGSTSLEAACEGPSTPGDVVRVQLRPAPVPILTGRLLQGGEPAARTQFSLAIDGRPATSQPSETDAAGRFRIPCTAPIADDERHQVTCTRLDANGHYAGWIARWNGRSATVPGEHELGDLEFVEVPLVIAGRFVAANGKSVDESVTAWVEAATGPPDAPWQAVNLRSQRQADGTFTFRGTAPNAALRLCAWTRNRYLPVPPMQFAAPAKDVTVPLQSGGSLRVSILVRSPTQQWCTTPRLVAAQPATEPPLFARYAMELDPAVPLHSDVVREHEGELEVAYTWPAVAPGRYRLQVRTRNVTTPLLEVPDVIVVDGERNEESRLQRLRLPEVRVVELKLPQARSMLAAADRPPTDGAGMAFVLDGDTPTDQCMQVDGDFVLFASARPLDVLVRLHGHRDLVVRGVFEQRTLQLEPGIPCTIACDAGTLPAGGRLDVAMTWLDDAMATASPWIYSPAAGGSLGKPRYGAPTSTRPLTDGAATFALPHAGRYLLTATWTDADRRTTPATITPAEVRVTDVGGPFAVTVRLSR